MGALEDAAELIQASVRNLENAIGGARTTSSASHFKYDTEEINTQIAGQTNEDLSEALASHDYSISVSSKNGKISLGDNTQQVKEHYENLTLTVLHETISTIMNTVSMTISDIILSETDIGNFLAAARDSIAKAAEEGTSSKQEAEDVMDQEGETEKARFIRYTFKTKELASKNKEESTIGQQNLETASYIIKIFNAKDKTIKNSHLTGKERFLSNEDGIIKVLEPSNTEAMKQIAFNFTSKTAESSYWFGQQTIIYNSSMLITRVASGIKSIIEKGIKKDY